MMEWIIAFLVPWAMSRLKIEGALCAGEEEVQIDDVEIKELRLWSIVDIYCLQ